MIKMRNFFERKREPEIEIEIPNGFLLDILKEIQNKFDIKLPKIIIIPFIRQYILDTLKNQKVKIQNLENLRNWLLNQEKSFWIDLLEFHKRRILVIGLASFPLYSIAFYLGNRFIHFLKEFSLKEGEEIEKDLYLEIIENLKSFINNIDVFDFELAKVSIEESSESSSLEIYFLYWDKQRISLKEGDNIELIGFPFDKTKKIKYDNETPYNTFRFKVYYLELQIPKDVEVETLPSEFLDGYIYLTLGDTDYIFNDPYLFRQFYRKYFKIKKEGKEILISVPIPSYNPEISSFDEKERKIRIPLLILDNPVYPQRLNRVSRILEVFSLKLFEEKSGILFLITKLWYLLRIKKRFEKKRRV